MKNNFLNEAQEEKPATKGKRGPEEERLVMPRNPEKALAELLKAQPQKKR